MNQRDEYERELTAGRAEIAAVLSGVADGLRAGAIRVGDDLDAVSVDVPDELTLEVELEVEDDGLSLELELEWPTDGDSTPESAVEATSQESDQESDEDPALVGAADETASLAHFEVYQARDAEWHWRLRHRNGNIIATGGEGYTRKANALKGLRSVMANSPDAAITDESTE